MEFGSGDDLGKLLHVDRLDIDNVYIDMSNLIRVSTPLTKTLVGDSHIPEIDSQVIG
jgi:hypothetical protein